MNVKEEFQRVFGKAPNIAIQAPGRVNLIGEHTDYNDGFVLPIAIDKSIKLASGLRDDKKVSIVALDFEDRVFFSIEGFKKSEENSWSNYPKGIVNEFLKLDNELKGFNALITGDIATGAGLSSSAALEVALAYAISSLNHIDLKPTDMARLCQRSENFYVGVNSGIMDQFVSILGKREHALFLDCRDLSYEYIHFPPGVSVVICNSRVKRELAGSEYNKRRKQCEEAVKILSKFIPGIKSLRDLSNQDFQKYQSLLPEEIRGKVWHVLTENQRVKMASEALKEGDLQKFGSLMNKSHKSLRDNYQVSCEELDLLTEIALSVEGVFGAKLTGAGFGGSTVNLVQAGAIDTLIEEFKSQYKAKTGISPHVYVCSAECGAREI